MYTILIEASGSLTAGYLIKSIQQAGAKAVASDIEECAAVQFADDFIYMPKHNEKDLWLQMENKMKEHRVNMVIPSFDETLLSWAERKVFFASRGIQVILSDVTTIRICQDKWLTYEFFLKNSIPTPQTSLEHEFGVVKPRLGRGGKGIVYHAERGSVPMEGMISQELLTGEEYTIDVFCDFDHRPAYIIPRKRLQVRDGKSINSITVYHVEIIELVRKICAALPFYGPINMQCFVSADGAVKFTEINPRIAGGMALGFAASENWINLILRNLIAQKRTVPVEVNYGLKMFRYYDEVFTI